MVKVCHKYKIPIIPFSGGSSLEGNFATPFGGMSIDFVNMGDIVELRPADMDVTVQPSIGWMDLNDKIKDSGLFFPIDPGPTAKIGGMVGTNCSGTHAVKYGTMRDWVINLTVVLADGRVIKTRRRPRKSSAGYNLNHLFVGSEGTLGIVTEITLKLAPIPEHTGVGVVTFPSMRAAAKAATEVVYRAIPVGAVEILDDVQMMVINKAGHTDRTWKEAPTLFFKFTGSKSSVRESIAEVSKVVKSNGGGNLEFAQTPLEQEKLWSARKQVLWSMLTMRKPGDEVWSTDVAVPLSRVADLVEVCKKELDSLELLGTMVGHIGDGNFHEGILYGEKDRAKVEECVHNMVHRAIEMEGTCTRSLTWLLKYQHPAYENLDHTQLPATSSSPVIDDGSVRPSEEMARLQLAPQTAIQPRLLAQNKQTNGLTTPGGQQHQQRRRQEPSPATSSRPTKIETPVSHAPQSRQTVKAPASAYADSVFDDVLDIDNVEQVDLTTAEPHSSSFGDFGTPERLWDEGSATRVWPLSDKRGKKRKSDEYLHDFLSPRSRQGSAKRKADSSQTRSAAVDILDRWSDFEEEDNDEATQKPAQPEMGDPPSIQQPQYGSQISRSKGAPGNQMCCEHRRDSLAEEPKHEPRDSVPDSDDEDLMLALGEPEPEPELAAPPSPRAKQDQGSQLLQHAKIGQHSRDGQNSSICQVTNLRQSTPTHMRQLQQTGSPTHQNLPTPPAESGGCTPRRECAPPMPEPTPSTSKRLNAADQAIVAKYMDSGTAGIKSFLTRLEASKQQTIDEYAEIRIRGDPVPDWLKTKKETIAARIVAANKLLDLHGQYATTLKEKESCKRRMVEMLNNDEDIDGPFATHIDELAARCHAQETAIFSQLRAAGLEDMSPSSKARTANASSSEPLDRIGVLVASTQKASPRSPRKTKQASQSQDEDNVAGPIAQRRLPHPTAYDGNFSAEHSRRQSPANFHRIVQSPPKHTHDSKRRAVNVPTIHAGKAATTEENYDDLFDDDEDMLEAANAFEQGHGIKPHGQRNPSLPRAALSDMSDNIRRPVAGQSSSKAKPNAALMSNPLAKEALSALRKRFHLEGFRQNQLEAIIETMSGRDAFVLMPTGGGKSLCYQLPAILDCGVTRGVTVVVSPLLSLMQDQVDHLQKLKIQAMLINSEVTAEHKELVFEALRGPNPQRLIQLLYITPEMLTKSGKLNNALDDLFARHKLARIVIDEAHCVSQWGHDFRPDYKDIGNVRKRFNGVPAMALTATATENVKVDVMHNLGMTGCKVFTQSFNRPNLNYEVRPKVKGYLDSIAETINDSYPGQSGIVYCLSRRDCERLAKKLSEEYGISATHYHALLSPQEKASVQKRWQSGDCQVIVATIAFGMGIDKPDVRFVIHNTIPKSLEGYYQETGRAGRDGQRSGCYLYYSFNDTNALRRMINEGEGNAEQKERQRQMLRNVVQFCENRSDCRRSQVLAYFNERFSPDQCEGGCDNCNSNSVFQLEDFTEHARNAVDLVRQVENDGVTLLHCVDVYRGAKGVAKIRTMGHDKMREYGMGKGLERGDCERLFQRLVSDDVLEEHQKTNRAGWTVGYVRLGAKVGMVNRGIFKLHIQVRVSPNGKSKVRPSKPARKKAPARDTGTGPVRTMSKPNRAPKRRSGPPIALDERVAGLDPSHRHVLDWFVEQGRALVIKTMQDKDLRTRPVADVVLREIAIEFPETKEAMLKIRGMTEETYKLIGPQLLRLARSARSDYEAIVQAQADLPTEANAARVVEISDDEDYGADDVDFPESFEDEEAAAGSESSRYFSANGDGDGDTDGLRDQSKGDGTISSLPSLKAHACHAAAHSAMPLSEISNHGLPSDSISRKKPPSEAASDQSSSLPPSAVLNMLRTTTELGDVGEFATRPPRIPRSISRVHSTIYPRSGSFATSVASANDQHQKRPSRQYGSRAGASSQPQQPFARPLNRSRSRSNWLPPNLVIPPSQIPKASFRASSPAYSEMKSYAATPRPGFMRAPSASTVASSPAALIPSGLLWRRPDCNTSYGSLKRFPSLGPYMINSHSGVPFRAITPMSASFQGARSIRSGTGVSMADLPKSATGSTVPAYYDYSESFFEEDSFSPDCGHAADFQSPSMDRMTFEPRPSPPEREAQTPFGTCEGSVFRPLELPTTHNRRPSEQSTYSKQSSQTFNPVIPKRVSSLVAPKLCKSDSVQSGRRCSKSQQSNRVACETRRSSSTGNTPSSTSVFFANAARSPRDLATLAAGVHLPLKEGEASPDGIRPDQRSSPATSLCLANFGGSNTPNWELPELPSMSFTPLAAVQFSQTHSDRPKTSEATPCIRPVEILSPMPSRPVSSQSRKRFSSILELADRHVKRSTSHLNEQKAGMLNKVEEAGATSSSRVYNEDVADSDQRTSQATSQDRSIIDSLLDRHIECLGLGPDVDNTTGDTTDGSRQNVKLDDESSAEETIQLTELLAKAPSWPKDRRWTSHSQQPSSLDAIERQRLRPRSLFASRDVALRGDDTPACSSDSIDQKPRHSYGWQTLPSSSMLSFLPSTILSSLSSGEIADIDSDGQQPKLKVKRRLNVSSQLSELSSSPHMARECSKSGPRQRSRSELVAREESRRRRRIRMMLKVKMNSRTLDTMVQADLTQHAIPDLNEGKPGLDQGSTLKTPADGYAELSAEAATPSVSGIEGMLSKPWPVPAQWSSIVVAMTDPGKKGSAMTDPVKKGSGDISRQASKYSKRSQRSNTSIVQPINSSRITYPLARPRSLPKIAPPDFGAAKLAPPDFGPGLTTSDLNLSIPYADVPSTIRPTLRESKSCFSDDSSIQVSRRNLRQKLTLQNLRHALPGSVTSVAPNEMLPREANTVAPSHSCRIKGPQSLDGNAWTAMDDHVVPMSDFAYKKRKVVEKIKGWWQKQCVSKKLRPVRRREGRAVGVVVC
ncbi:hypothetical protein DV735_g1106, partial [Chaetothyriales sp. CBS 134920]